MQKEIRNSYFTKSEATRYIEDMDTDNPKLTPQYYSFVEPMGGATMTSSHFEFDGQFFTRKKEHGGNEPSRWIIMGKSPKAKDLPYRKNKKQQEGFDKMLGFIMSLSYTSSPQGMIFTQKDADKILYLVCPKCHVRNRSDKPAENEHKKGCPDYGFF